MNPFPGAYTIFEGKICKIQQANFVPTTPQEKPNGSIESDGKTYLNFWVPDGKVEILEWQMEGKKKMKIDEFLRGYLFNPTIKG